MSQPRPRADWPRWGEDAAATHGPSQRLAVDSRVAEGGVWWTMRHASGQMSDWWVEK